MLPFQTATNAQKSDDGPNFDWVTLFTGVMEWWNGGIENWGNGKLMEWKIDGMENWWNGKLVELKSGGM